MNIRNVLLTGILSLALLVPRFTPAQSAKLSLAKQVSDAVVLLYEQDQSGGMQMLCSATNYKQTDKTHYRFASASHCVFGKTDTEQKSAKYFVTMDTEGAKTFVPAKLIEAGDRAVGDDFSIFEVQSDKPLTVIPLGDDTILVIGDTVVNIAAPLGLGKQYFEGYISERHIDRPPLDAGDVKWHDAMLIDIGGGPGSSGSSIISVGQQKIVGFLVGSTSANIGMIIIPVSQFKAFEAKVDAGTYKKTKADDKLIDDGIYQ